MVTLVVIAVLVALNAIYVAAEFAIVAARRPEVDRLAQTGDRAARRVAGVMSDPRHTDRYIATAQLGITLASLGLGMYGESVLASWLMGWLGGLGVPGWLASHAVAGIMAVLVLTYLHIVLGEMIPKAIALSSAERTAIWMSPAISITGIATYPLIRLLDWTGNRLLRALNLSQAGQEAEKLHTPEELQYIVRESEQNGLLGPEAAEVIGELLEFGQLTAGEVMVPRVHMHSVELGGSLDELRGLVLDAPHTRYPVHGEDIDQILGTIHIKDVLRRIGEGETITEADLHSVPFLPETSTLDKVLAAMREQRTQMAIVMDEHGGTAGLITIEDLFEEVVGSIDDAVTTHAPELYRDQHGDLHVHGTVRVEEVGEELELPLEHEEVDSVSGLVLALLDRPPVVGDVVEFEGVGFEVLAIEGHGVTECKVTVPRRAQAGEGAEPDAPASH